MQFGDMNVLIDTHYEYLKTFSNILLGMGRKNIVSVNSMTEAVHLISTNHVNEVYLTYSSNFEESKLHHFLSLCHENCVSLIFVFNSLDDFNKIDVNNKKIIKGNAMEFDVCETAR